MDEDGIDGWCPATYLEKVSAQKSAQLQREYEKRMKEEEEKRRKTELMYNNFDENESTVMDLSSSALKDELMAKAASYASRMKERRKMNQSLTQQIKQNQNQKYE